MKYIESETIELKKSTSEIKEAVISICAILNKHGKGTLYFCIADDGSIIGQQIGKATLKDISKSISDHLEPKIYPHIKNIKLSGKDCIIVDFDGKDGLYSAFGRFYLRAGEEDKKLSVSEIRRMVEKLNNYAYTWGGEVSGDAVSTASAAAIKSFIEKGRKAGRISFPYDNPANVLRKLGLVAGGRLLNAAKALFSTGQPLTVQAAVFAGRDKITFLDIQNYQGNIFEMAAKAELYVQEHINWRADLSGSSRVEIPEIPVRAIKEAIINSLCHRDFANPKSNEVAIYKDRIEIFNPGLFPYEYTPEDFIKGSQPSIPRNPLIAETLFRSEDIEKWGSGLRRISAECRKVGIKVRFVRNKSGFTVVFYRPIAKDNAQAGKTAGGVSGGVNGGVNSLLACIASRPGLRLPALAVTLAAPTKTVEKWLVRLKSENKIIYKGSPKTGGYYPV